MRRIALFSDIHGNLHALDAVLADIDSRNLTERYCLGDMIGYGPDPQGVVARLRERGIPSIQGNYDEGVASRRGDCGCYYGTEQDRALGEQSYAFTDAALTPQTAEWILSLPKQIELAEGDARILLTHGSPRKINEYLPLDRDESQLARLATAAGVDVVCHGHIHVPYHRSFSTPTLHYVSSGSVGKPKDGDQRACWIELVMGSEVELRRPVPRDEASAAMGASRIWLGVRFHRLEYDIDSVVAEMLAKGLPEELAEALRDA